MLIQLQLFAFIDCEPEVLVGFLSFTLSRYPKPFFRPAILSASYLVGEKREAPPIVLACYKI